MRNLGQIKCKRCRRWHLECMLEKCIDDERWEEVKQYAAQHGRKWKSILREEWLTATGDASLQWLRNIIAPSEISSLNPEARKYQRR